MRKFTVCTSFFFFEDLLSLRRCFWISFKGFQSSNDKSPLSGSVLKNSSSLTLAFLVHSRSHSLKGSFLFHDFSLSISQAISPPLFLFNFVSLLLTTYLSFRCTLSLSLTHTHTHIHTLFLSSRWNVCALLFCVSCLTAAVWQEELKGSKCAYYLPLGYSSSQT